jgi:hypothetical protein
MKIKAIGHLIERIHSKHMTTMEDNRHRQTIIHI